jgi:hypothetical protein
MGQFMQVEKPGNLHAFAPIHGTFVANYSKSQVRARRFHGKRIAKHSGLLFGNDSSRIIWIGVGSAPARSEQTTLYKEKELC